MNSLSLKKKTVYIAMACIVVVIGQVAKIVGSDAITIVALICTAFFAFCCKKEDLFGFFILFIASNRLLTYGPISAPTIIILVGLFKNVGCVRKINRKFAIQSFFLVVLSVMTIINGESQFFDAIKIIFTLLFVMTYVDSKTPEIAYLDYLSFCSYGCVVPSAVAIVMNPSSLQENSRFALAGNSENVLGILCGILIINIICVLLKSEAKNKFEFLCLAVAMLFVGFLTGSRSFLLVIGVGVIVIVGILVIRLKMRGFFKIFILVVMAGGIAWIVFNNNSFIQSYTNQIIYRITKLQGMDVSNGRYELWEQYYSVLISHPMLLLFGGMSITAFKIPYVAHNMILEQIAAYGIIGSILLIIMYLNVYKYIRKNSNTHIVFSEMHASLIALLVVSMVSHTLLGVSQTIMLLISGLAILGRK